MSSGLSGTCQTATMLSEDYDGKVVVVNNQRISVTMRQSVLDALKLSQKGYTATQIKEILERDKMESSVYITLETLKYLRKGGRITAGAAAVGTLTAEIFFFSTLTAIAKTLFGKVSFVIVRSSTILSMASTWYRH